MIEYNVPSTIPYLILEGVSKQHKNSKIIHVLNLGGIKDIKLGRGHESDIRISDISVSRVHASIWYVNGKFYIKDLDAKFGTLKAF